MKKYEILGGNLPVVVCELSAGESMITESGSMSWMSPIYRRRCRRNDCICIKFSGSDQSIGD